MFFKKVQALEEEVEDKTTVMLFLIAFGDGTIDEKLEHLIHLILQPVNVKTKLESQLNASLTGNENISRERAASILERLLLLTSVEIIEAI